MNKLDCLMDSISRLKTRLDGAERCPEKNEYSAFDAAKKDTLCVEPLLLRPQDVQAERSRDKLINQ